MSKFLKIAKQLIIGVDEVQEPKKEKGYCLKTAIGIKKDNTPLIVGVDKMVHCLIAGASGSGKGVGLQYSIATMLAMKENVDFELYIIDVKLADFNKYEEDKRVTIIPRIDLNSEDDNVELVEEASKQALEHFIFLKKELSRRVRKIAKAKVRDIGAYYNKGHRDMKPIIMVIDEYAFIKNNCADEVDKNVGDIMAIGRSVGIHIWIATQYPNHKIISKDKSGNAGARICYKVKNKVAEQVVGVEGASKLRGAGNALVDFDWEEKPIKVKIPYWGDKKSDKVFLEIAQGKRDYLGNAPQKKDRSLLYKLIIGQDD